MIYDPRRTSATRHSSMTSSASSNRSTASTLTPSMSSSQSRRDTASAITTLSSTNSTISSHSDSISSPMIGTNVRSRHSTPCAYHAPNTAILEDSTEQHDQNKVLNQKLAAQELWAKNFPKVHRPEAKVRKDSGGVKVQVMGWACGVLKV